ncbi:MAG: zinc ABC transporter substrate-binding protein [Proteobacteria bacterium]|nr:zinc ABC transporter substrate-binding protein [Pseudomonadota bacterium]
MKKLLLLVTAFLFLTPLAHAAEDTKVVATIKPLHSLVQAVMGDTGTAGLLVDGNASPHGFALKPSQIRMTQNADILFLIDLHFEQFMENVLASAPSVAAVSVVDEGNLTLLELREGGAWEDHGDHDHGHGDKDHKEHSDHKGHSDHSDHADHDEVDLHVWLNTANARDMVQTITKALGSQYPENRSVYKANARALIIKLEALETENQQKLSPYKDKAFIVLHDAYPYFEAENGLTAVGSITIEPDDPPSINRLKEIRQKITETNTVCVFREPQFDDRLVQTAIEGSDARQGTLDPIGANFEPGPDLYLKLMTSLADNFVDCMSQ